MTSLFGSSDLTPEGNKGVGAALRPKIFIRRWRIDLRYFYIFGIFATFLGIFLDATKGETIRGYLLWMTARGLSMAGMYIFWLTVANFVDRRNLSPMPLWQILVLGGLGGAVQTICFELLIWLFLLPSTSNIYIRLASAAFMAGIWLPAQSVIVINFTRYQKMYESIQDQLIQLETVKQARKRLRALDEDILRKQIVDLVLKSRDKASAILERALDDKSPANLPDVARGLASDQLRVLAHEISELNLATESKKHWWNIDKRFSASVPGAILKSIRTRPLNPEWFLLVLLATISLPLFGQRGLLVASSVLAAIAIVCYLIHLVGFFLYARYPRSSLLNTFLVTTFTIVIPILLLGRIPGNTPTVRNEIAYTLTVLIITGFGHLAQAGLLQQEELMAIEKSTLDRSKKENADINMELARITKTWAQHIHGNIQSRLHAFALVLEQAQLRDDTEGVERAIEEITRTIKELDREQTASVALTLEEEIAATCSLWDGIVDIRSDIQREIRSLKAPITSDMNRCLIEAITNSVRHGHADRMMITFFAIGEEIRLEVKDNGVGFTKIGKGLGSKTFDAATGNRWDLVRNAMNNETTLTLNFALESNS
jgi:signal transduction histidine kinase